MKHISSPMLRALPVLGLTVLVASMTGCPHRVSEDAKVIALLKSQSTVTGDLGKSVVDALFVTVTEISLDYVGDGSEDSPEDVVIFSGAMEVNLFDLTDLAAVISEADIPAGEYTKIRIAIESPRLYLASDPSTPINDVHLTANGHLFVSKSFTIEDGDSTLLTIEFNGFHLVENGNGGFVLTPQLDATITTEPAPAVVTGTVIDLNLDADTVTVEVEPGTNIVVSYANASIFLSTDTDTATGTEDNLAIGLQVQAEGLLTPEGTLEADTVRILDSV